MKKFVKLPRLIFNVRPFASMFICNWYGIRKGTIWVYPPEQKYAIICDIGMVRIGFAI